MIKPLRIIDSGDASAVRSHALYHGLAAAFAAGDPPILSLVSPSEPHLSIGMHQDFAAEIDAENCARRGLPIIRRRLGGGAVLIDQDQLFFHFIVSSDSASDRPAQLFRRFAAPVIATYAAFGIEARHRPPADIVVHGRKIGASAAAVIGAATIVIGSFLFDFDHAAMAEALRAPSLEFRAAFRVALQTSMTSMRALLAPCPSREAVKRRFVVEAGQCLDLPIEASLPTTRETEAIEREAVALSDPLWTKGRESACAPEAVKLAEGTRLTERKVATAAGIVRLVYLERDGRIAALEILGPLGGMTAAAKDALARRLTDTALEPQAIRAALAAAKTALGLPLEASVLETLAGALAAPRHATVIAKPSSTP